MSGRRDFIKTSGLITGATMVMGTDNLFASAKGKYAGKGSLKLRFRPYTLNLKHAFNLATSSRTTTPVVLTEIEYDGIIGYGEASMPPYLGESHESVLKFLSKVDLSRFDDPFQMENILHYVDGIEDGNKAAKASVDIALHDLTGKIMKQPWHRIWGYDPSKTPVTSFTIGIDTPEVVRQKVKEADPYKILKVKLGRDTDKQMIETIREITDKPLCVDVNQGWKDRQFALDMAHWLKEKGVVFLEQPMPKEQIDDMAWLTERSPVPTIGDESVQRLDDVLRAYKVYSGINIKLMKCTGMREAHKMLTLARALGMKVMMGCMTETSCAISAAAQLAPMVDWADLDGALLISNDVFKGTTVVNGKVTLNPSPGIGVSKL
ncbi:dipeptide epimerase [Pararcticibacter amylolyticus]|uniref:Dipeptide epimerase n=1 Tax=Pararcticibacter amylolyticus TaxID=2173175 RepID=A0A2U2PHN3_9SPHI|nr:dipeptide epimerase [Pararcticibacter amylolyticus]PWG80772.1 dipeptide epimerase [Pararcticibacter amylolyticus]